MQRRIINHNASSRWELFLLVGIVFVITFCLLIPVPAAISSNAATLFLDFETEHSELKLLHGARRVTNASGGVLEFSSPRQCAEVPFSQRLDGLTAMSVGGWFQPWRSGEQYFVARGIPATEPLGNRMFPRQEQWVNFVLGTDQRGFLLGTINGNGWMPFPYVTVNEVGFDAWNQVVVVKAANGQHRFYLNGTLIHSTQNPSSGLKIWPFRDTEPGEPLRLAMPLGGRMGEVWVFSRELTADEIAADYRAKRERYQPARPGVPVRLREMNAHPAANLWPESIAAENWPQHRRRISAAAHQVLGALPREKVPLDPRIIGEEDCGQYIRRKVSLQVQPGDRMPAYLLIPKHHPGRLPAILCFYGTSNGAGKDTTVGLSGRKPGTPPQRNEGFALDLVEAGFVAFAPDYLRDGERLPPSGRPYDTTDFYARFPEWSIHGKDIWDNSRAIDYLQTLDFVDPEKIGMTGHSYGGHSTIFAAAMEPRIKVAVANGPVSDFEHHGMHWGVPKGAGNSQSMPALRPFLLDRSTPLPLTFYEFTALIAPRPLLVGQAAGERRPFEEENFAAVAEVYRALGCAERVRYHWYAGDHDYPLEARAAAVAWFQRWFKLSTQSADNPK